MHAHFFATVKARTGFSRNVALKQFLLMLIAAILASDKGNAAPDDKPSTQSEIRHSDLSVYLSDDGTLKPIRTTDDWELRRKQIIQGAEAAMGEMPTAPPALR